MKKHLLGGDMEKDKDKKKEVTFQSWVFLRTLN